MLAYLVSTMDVHNAEAFKEYQSKVRTFVEKHGGRFIVRGGERITLEGSWPAGRTIVVEFSGYSAVKAFVNDPEYAPIAAIRHAHSDSHVFIVEGVAEGSDRQDYGGYLLASVAVEDPETYKGYAAQVPAVVEHYRGTFLARGGRTEGVEGTPDPDRIVLIGFADTASVRRFHGASEYAPLIEIRHNASTGNVVAMEAYQP